MPTEEVGQCCRLYLISCQLVKFWGPDAALKSCSKLETAFFCQILATKYNLDKSIMVQVDRIFLIKGSIVRIVHTVLENSFLRVAPLSWIVATILLTNFRSVKNLHLGLRKHFATHACYNWIYILQLSLSCILKLFSIVWLWETYKRLYWTRKDLTGHY